MLGLYETLIDGLLEKGFQSVDNWLTNDELIGLRKSLLAHHENNCFYNAGIGNKAQLQTIKSIRNDLIFWLDPLKANAFEENFLQKINDFVAYLNRTCYTGIRSHEFQYAIYNVGAFYKKHVDTFKNDDKRKFSVVFYLTENWQPGDGGELKIFANDTVEEIQPIGGRLVFFNSDIPHEVLKSNTKRLSLTGWLKTS